MKQYGGKVLFLDRSDITTNEIIPEKYINNDDKTGLKNALLEGLQLEGFNYKTDVPGIGLIISRENFGTGENSSFCVESFSENEINVIVCSSFSKDFKSCMTNSNLMAIEFSKKDIDDMFRNFADKDTEAKVVINNEENTAKVKLISGSLSKSYYFNFESISKGN